MNPFITYFELVEWGGSPMKEPLGTAPGVPALISVPLVSQIGCPIRFGVVITRRGKPIWSVLRPFPLVMVPLKSGTPLQ